MQVRDVYVNGVGVYLPDTESIDSAVRRGLLPAGTAAAMGFTGAAVAGDLPAPEMALRAARDAVGQSGIGPTEIGCLLYADVWFQGPAAWQPQLYLQHHLIGDAALAVEIRHGCVGMLSGIELAVGSLRADPGNRAALVVSADNFGTPLMDRWTSGAGWTVLADGASAVVLSREAGLAEVRSVCTAGYTEMEEQWRSAEPLFPPGATVGRTVDFLAGQEASHEELQSSGALSRIALTHMQRISDCTSRALADAGITHQDVTRVLPNTMPREETRGYLGMLGWGLERSAWDFGRALGHMGASDQVTALHHLLGTGELAPGDHVLLCGLSPGVTYKAAVLRILDPGGARAA